MAYKRKDIMEIRQMILLKIQGKSNRQIAKLLGINRNTINNYIQLFKSKGKNLEELKDLEEEKLLVLINEESPPEVSKRQAELLAYFPQILKNKKRVGFTFKKMWEEYKAEYIEGAVLRGEAALLPLLQINSHHMLCYPCSIFE
jgi:transposase